MPNTSQLEIFGPRDGQHDHFTTGPVPEFLVDDIEDAIRELRDAGVEIARIPASALTSDAIVHQRVASPPVRRHLRNCDRCTNFRKQLRETNKALAEIDEDIEVEINDKDLRVDTYRATGAGGQHINTTDSAVRITHMPTGIVVSCQNQRSQHQNRAVAMQVLRSRLYELELERRRAETAELEANKADISFGSQIRSYVLAPYQLVKDTRTKLERGNVDAVLGGDIDDFIKAYLLARKAA